MKKLLVISAACLLLSASSFAESAGPPWFAHHRRCVAQWVRARRISPLSVLPMLPRSLARFATAVTLHRWSHQIGLDSAMTPQIPRSSSGSDFMWQAMACFVPSHRSPYSGSPALSLLTCVGGAIEYSAMIMVQCFRSRNVIGSYPVVLSNNSI